MEPVHSVGPAGAMSSRPRELIRSQARYSGYALMSQKCRPVGPPHCSVAALPSRPTSRLDNSLKCRITILHTARCGPRKGLSGGLPRLVTGQRPAPHGHQQSWLPRASRRGLPDKSGRGLRPQSGLSSSSALRRARAPSARMSVHRLPEGIPRSQVWP